MANKIGGYSSRSQVAALVRGMNDAVGNKDGIPNNESKPAGWAPKNVVSKQALLNKLATTFEPGLSTSDEEKKLNQFVAAREKAWGQPVSNLPRGAVANDDGFRAEKAIALVRFDRKPSDVTDGFVKASGTVDGQKIPDRDLFYQRWKPIGAPNGKVVVLSPGFQETGRNFYEQINMLNKQGYEVAVMDHQWAGYSSGPKGGVDRGFGVARDVAAVTAQVAKDSPGKKIILMGNSMGAGPGVLGALTLNDAGKIQLGGGAQMPKGLDAVLQAPFIGMTPSALNKGLEAVSHVPFLNDVALPSSGLPVLTNDPAAQAKLAQHVAEENITARPEAMSAATADLATIRKMIDSGQGPKGRIYIIHGDHDPLADPNASREVAGKLGANAKLDIIHSNDHVLEESPSEQGHLLDAMKWLS